MIRFILNEKEIATDNAPGMTLLDFIRYHQHLTGTKIGCREGDCGACTILVGKIVADDLCYESMTSCLMPLGNAQGKHIVTIEGINLPGTLNPVQQIMADAGATQCGFCTPGFVMSLAGFCLSDKEATTQNAIAAMDGNICRCTGYKSIERAAGKIAEVLKKKNGEETTRFVTKEKILPEYFSNIKSRLKALNAAIAEKSRTPGSELQTILGGGTDLYVQKHEEVVQSDIHFVFDDPKMNVISQEENNIIIGPSVTVTGLLESRLFHSVFPEFHRFAKLISSTPIRNMATIAGNFVNASPIGDMTIFFLALDAQLELCKKSSKKEIKRTVSLRKFYKGYKQLDKKPKEIISKIWFEIPVKGSYFNFEKVSKRTHLDIASVNTAISLRTKESVIESADLSAGGVGPIPMFLKKTSSYLKGKKITNKNIEKAIEVMKTEISPISDARGTKEYKTLLLGQLIKAHLLPLIK